MPPGVLIGYDIVAGTYGPRVAIYVCGQPGDSGTNI